MQSRLIGGRCKHTRVLYPRGRVDMLYDCCGVQTRLREDAYRGRSTIETPAFLIGLAGQERRGLGLPHRACRESVVRIRYLRPYSKRSDLFVWRYYSLAGMLIEDWSRQSVQVRRSPIRGTYNVMMD